MTKDMGSPFGVMKILDCGDASQLWEWTEKH